MDRRTLLHTAALGGIALGSGLSQPAHAVTGSLDDLTIIRRALDLHPGLYRYQSPAQFQHRFAVFAREWAARPALEKRFLALSRLTAQVRCGHTQCNPFNQSDTVVAALFDRPTRLPFAFRWLREGMVVSGDSGAANGIALGSIIERLNGQAPRQILAALLPYARADGSNDAKRITQMEMRGDQEFEAFDIYQGLLFPPGPDGHRAEWRDPAGKRHAAVLPAIRYAARNALFPKPAENGPIWDWTVGSDGIALLTMPSWVTYRGDWDWRGWLTERLATLGSARGLVIDIRRNEGGTDCGTWLLQHLIDRPFHPLRYINRVRFREVAPDLTPYLTTWDRSFRTLGVGAQDGGDGFYTLAGDEDEHRIDPLLPRIPVPVAVLASPINSSATFSFLRRLREAKVARTFGGPSGGNLRGINGGAMFFVRLPQSGLEFDLPLKGYFPERQQPDAPVQPDVAVTNTAADIAAGYDRVLEAARAQLLKG